MKYIFYTLFLLGCGGDTFTGIKPALIFDSGSESAVEVEAGYGPDVLPWDGGLDAVSETSTVDSSPPIDSGGSPCKDSNDVEYMNHCFYLDGSKGICDSGYVLSSNAKLGSLLAAMPNAWQGKNYRHQISDNACILTKDSVQNYGMVQHANQPGPFSAGEPIANGSSCTGVYFIQPKQLTLCESL